MQAGVVAADHHPTLIAATATDDADVAGAADAGHDLVDAEFAQLTGDEFRRLLDLVQDAGIFVNVTTPGTDFDLAFWRLCSKSA